MATLTQTSDEMTRGKFRGERQVGAIGLLALIAFGQVLFVAESGASAQVGWLEHPHHRVSRAIGGNNRTWRMQEFDWLHILFRNPADSYQAPMDGYITGYAIELAHNVFLANSHAIERASVINKLRRNTTRWEMLGIRRANEKTYLNPNETVWRIHHPFGIFQEILNLRWDFKLYASDFVSGTVSKRYAGILDRQIIKGYACFVYAFSVIDWPEIQNFAAEWGLPPYPQAIDDANSPVPYFHQNETRYFSRWPVKLTVENCCNFTTGEFLFDFDHNFGHDIEDNNKDKYSSMKARWCDTWQDTGAPIMCASSRAPFFAQGFGTWTTDFEINNLKLSYVVAGRGARPSQAKTECHDKIVAYNLNDYREKIEQSLDTIKRDREARKRA